MIEAIAARETLDSRGTPTLQAEVRTTSGACGIAQVPSGASTGSREALELRDGDAGRYRGRGVLRACRNVTGRIAPALHGIEITDQARIDQTMIELDGTPGKSALGANAMLAVSMAAARAAAEEQGTALYAALPTAGAMRMPVPMMNLINGGRHADNGLDFQEFMILPVGAPNLREAVRYGCEVFLALRDELQARGLRTAVGDEGGFSPELASNRAAIELLLQAVQRSGLAVPGDVMLGLDVASTEFFDNGRYRLEDREYDSDGIIEWLADWTEQYPILSIEDGLAEEDWDGWQRLTRRLGTRVQLVGDDLFVTNTAYLRRGIEHHTANSILIKLNQVGTLTETLEALQLARQHGYTSVISHRSGETEDTFIADLAVASGAGQIKTGSLSRSERVAKYNRLMWIEDQINAEYPGAKAFPQLQ